MLTFREYIEGIRIRTADGDATDQGVWDNYHRGNPPVVLPAAAVKKLTPQRLDRVFKNLPGLKKVGPNLMTPKRNLGVPRAHMPQIQDRDHYVNWLSQNGIPVRQVMVNPLRLIKSNSEKLTAHAQANIYPEKAQKFLKKNTLLHKLIILTSDNIIFDGNHHWTALIAAMKITKDKKTKFPMYQVGMDFTKLKELTKQYPEVTYEEGLRFLDYVKKRDEQV